MEIKYAQERTKEQFKRIVNSTVKVMNFVNFNSYNVRVDGSVYVRILDLRTSDYTRVMENHGMADLGRMVGRKAQ